MDRIVYILTPQGRALECSLRLTRLMKWEAFSDADLSDLRVLFTRKYASYLTAERRSIVMGLLQLVSREGEWPILSGEYGYELLGKMLEQRCVFFAFGNHLPLKWGEPVEGELAWEPVPGREGEWQTRLELPDGLRAFDLNPPIYIDGEGGRCGLVVTGQPDALVMRWLAARPMPEQAVANFCLRMAKDFPEARFPTPAFAKLEESSKSAPVALLTVQQRAITDKSDRDAGWIDLRDRLRLRLRFEYGKARVAWDAAEAAVSFREGGAIKRVARDKAWEKKIIARLEEWGFSAGEQGASLDLFDFDSSTFALRKGQSWRRMLEEVFPKLDTAEWKVEMVDGLEIRLIDESDLCPDVQEGSGDSFCIGLEVAVDGQREPLLPHLHRFLRRWADRGLSELMTMLREESYALRLDGGGEKAGLRTFLAVLPNGGLARTVDQLYELFDRKPFDAEARARVSRWRLGELVAAGLVGEDSGKGVSEAARICRRIGSGIEVKRRRTPRALRAKLRDYQRSGLGWLAALADVGAGGILADDMGLGKTAQTIAHLLDLKQAGALSQGALVVAPTSVIDNWEEELGRFAPSLSVARFHGRRREEAWTEGWRNDVLLTTYALLRLEIERLKAKTWSLAILDEAQYIKNPGSRTAMAARELRAARKLCLTGTPIENRLEDVWSLFEFLLPGFLGDEATFRSRIAQPLKEAEDAALAGELRARLRRRLSPFVLRRRKAEVLKDLPERTEVVRSVSMGERQRELYDSFRKEARSEIKRGVAANGIAGSRMLILSRLLRLRQICCDPRLIEEARDAFGAVDSAKLEAFLELAEDLLEQGSRILVFSQFTSVLDLLAEALEARRIGYLMLTGSTTNRADLVGQFQKGTTPIFLISLRAGGFGLNLTAADCVIHFDPWWNPAVEQQASDRVHRMGQSKPVFVYKLIVDDSIESRIQQLQRKKLKLVEDLLAEGDVERLEIDEETIDYLLGE